jgi:HEAT repeat protein
VALLAGVGEAAVAPIAAAIQQGPGPGRECLLSALARGKSLADPAVAPAVVAALDRASAAEERLVASLLPRLSPPPVAALAELLGNDKRPDEDRARAARALAALDRPEAFAALLAATGAGPTGLRASVRELLAAAKAPLAAQIREALEGQPPLPRRADLVFVLGAAAAREPLQREPSLPVLRSAAAAPDFEVVGRAVAALGRLGDEAAVAELSRLRQSSPDAVVRYLATRELASAAAPPALGAVREALDDGDPRVRETAALALGHRRDGASSGKLVAAAKQEPWPFVRRAEVSALGALCTAGDLLVRADERDVPEVRREALSGLARCRDPRAATLLQRALGRRAEDPDLRALAARLLGTLGDRAQARPMAEALARMRVEAQEDLALEGVTVVVMQSLARLGGPDAVGGAVQLLGDERPLFKRTALEALGQLCDGGPGDRAVAAALRDADAGVVAAAGAAQRRCQGKTATARPAP